MIILHLTRYYGSPNITKSRLTIENDQTGMVLFDGEARECRFYNYSKDEKVIGSSLGCLGTGEYQLTTTSTSGNPVCLRTTREPTRRGFIIYVNTDPKRQCSVKKLSIGYGTSSEPKYRKLTDLEKAKEDFTKIIYDNYLEEFRLIVKNEIISQGE